MDVYKHYNVTKFLAYVPKIRQSLHEWWMIDISLTGRTHHNSAYIAKKVHDRLQDREGAVFICNKKHLLVLAHMEPGLDGTQISTTISEKLPEFSCQCSAVDITADGLLKIQIRLHEFEEERQRVEAGTSRLFELRRRRGERIVMVADDDMFMRSLVVKTFRPQARMIECAEADTIVETYLDVLPDIVFLDIHLPGGSGLDVIKEIHSFDETAHVVILSSDSIRDNILTAQKGGAKGFLAKPFTPQKLEECYRKCMAAMAD